MAQSVLVPLDFTGGGSIKNLPSPVSSGDAANKSYVDAAQIDFQFAAYSEKVVATSTTSGTITLDASATVFTTTLTGSATLVLAAAIQTTGRRRTIIWEVTAGSYTITFPSGTVFTGSTTAPTLSTTGVSRLILQITGTALEVSYVQVS